MKPLFEAVMFCLSLLIDALRCKAVFSRSCLCFVNRRILNKSVSILLTIGE